MSAETRWDLTIFGQSQKHDWETPQPFFDALNEEFGFTLDVCATHETAKCERYFTPAEDGLSRSWHGETCWMNPPYGREIARWVAKADGESRSGATVVALLPARTDTAWWHDHIIDTQREVRFIRGRLRFSGSSINAPFPSAVVVFSPLERAA